MCKYNFKFTKTNVLIKLNGDLGDDLTSCYLNVTLRSLPGRNPQAAQTPPNLHSVSAGVRVFIVFFPR